MPRHYRRSMSRPITKTYKKVLNFAPASSGAGVQADFLMVVGTDSIAAGQSTVTDATVPTGSTVSYIDIAYADSNITASAAFSNLCIQYLLNSQTGLSPLTVGGNPQRNQVLHQKLYVMGTNQNSNHLMRFKIPKKFQRVREGMSWFLSTVCSSSHVQAVQIIYKIRE